MVLTHPGSTFADAWLRALGEILERGEAVSPSNDPTSIGTRFGRTERPTRELVGHSIVVADPRSRLFISRARPMNLVNAIAQCFWTLAGRDDVATIAHFVPAAADFSDDRVRIRSAIGHRILTAQPQLQVAIERLRADPSTRRASLRLAMPEDSVARTKDMPCLDSIHFHRRNERLQAVLFARSQSALMVLPYDFFVLSMLQEVVAVCLGIEPGAFLATAASFHIFEDEVSLAIRVRAEGVRPRTMPTMPAALPTTAAFARALDAMAGGEDSAEQERAVRALGPYWADLGLVLLRSTLSRARPGQDLCLPPLSGPYHDLVALSTVP